MRRGRIWFALLAAAAAAAPALAQTPAPSSAPTGATFALSRVSGATPALGSATPTSQGTMYFGAQAASPDASTLARTISSVNGDSWTVVNAGVYMIQVNTAFTVSSGGNTRLALARNLSPATSYGASAFTQQLASTTVWTGATANDLSVSWIGYLDAFDVVRAHVSCASACVFTAADVSHSITFVRDAAAAALTVQPASVQPVQGTSTAAVTALYFGAGPAAPNAAGPVRTVSAAGGDYWTVFDTGLYAVQATIQVSGTTTGPSFLSRNAASETAYTALTVATTVTAEPAQTNSLTTPWAMLELAAGDVVRVQATSISNTLAPTTYGVRVTRISAAVYGLSTWTTGATPAVGSGGSVTAVTFGAGSASPAAAGVARAVSAVNGDTFTVAAGGTFVVKAQWAASDTSALWVSRNAAATTLSGGMTALQSLGCAQISTTVGNFRTFWWVGVLSAGDVVRFHTNSAAIVAGFASVTFTAFTGSATGTPTATRVPTILPTASPASSYYLTRVSGAIPSFSSGTPTTVGVLSFGPQGANPNEAPVNRVVSTVNGDTWFPTITGYYIVTANVAVTYSSTSTVRLGITWSMPSASTDWPALAFANELAQYPLQGDAGTVTWSGFVSAGDVLRITMTCASPCVVSAAHASQSVTFIYDSAATAISTQLTSTIPAVGTAPTTTALYFGTGTPASPDLSGVTRGVSSTNGDTWTTGSAGLYAVRASFLGTGDAGVFMSRNAASTTTYASIGTGTATVDAFKPTTSTAVTQISWTGELASGDVVRFHTATVTPTPTTAPYAGVQFIKVSAVVATSVWTAAAVQPLRGSGAGVTALYLNAAAASPALAGVSRAVSSVNGDVFTVTTGGSYAVNLRVFGTAVSFAVWASRNAPVTASITGMDALQNLGAIQFSSADTGAQVFQFLGILYPGDAVRFHTPTGTPAAALSPTGSVVTFTQFTGSTPSPTTTSPTTAFPTTASPTTGTPTTGTPTTATPTTAVPTATPTAGSGGFVTLFSGTAQPTPTPSGTVFQLTTYWTGGASSVTVGTSLTAASPTPAPTSGRITVTPTGAGLYLVVWSLTFASDSGVTDRQGTVIKNGAVSNSVTNWNAANSQSAAATVIPRLSATDFVVMAATDYVNVNAISGSVNGMSVATPTQFTMASTQGKPYYIMFGGTTQTPTTSVNTPLVAYWSGTPQSLGTIVTTTGTGGQIKVTRAGAYLVSFGVFWAATTNNKQSWVTINAAAETQLNRYGWSSYTDATTTNLLTTAAAVVVLAANDFVRVNVYQDSGGNGNVNNGVTTHFAVVDVPQVYATLTSFTIQTVPSGADTELTVYWGGSTLVSAGGIWSVPSNGRIKASKGGGYYVTFGAYFQFVASGYRYIWVSINGGTTKYGQRSTSSATISLIQSTAFVQLAAGDYVSVWAHQDTGSPTTVDPTGTMSFSMVQMSDAGTTAAPTAASLAPTSSPTSSQTDYYQVFAGTAQAYSGSTVTELVLYWTAGPAARTSGSSVTYASGRFTAVTAGAYLTVWSVATPATGATAFVESWGLKNNAATTSTNRLGDINGWFPANTPAMLAGAYLTVLAASDFVSQDIYAVDAGSMQTWGSPQMATLATKGQPYYILSSGTAQSITNNVLAPLGTYWTAGAVPQSSGSVWSVPSAGQIRTAQAGVYVLIWGTGCATVVNTVQQSFVLLNGATASNTNRIGMMSRDDNSKVGTSTFMYTAAVVQLAANDYAQVNFLQVSGSTQTMDATYTKQFAVLRVTGAFGTIPSAASQAVAAGADTELTTNWGTFTSVGTGVSIPSAGRMRADVGGGYFVTFGVFWSQSSSTTNALRYVYVAVNGVLTIQYGRSSYGVDVSAAAANTNTKSQQSSAFVALNAGDYVSVWVWSSAAVSTNADAVVTTAFSMVQMSSTGVTSAPSSASLAPTSSPTGAASNGYYQLFAGGGQVIGSGTYTQLTTSWTGTMAARTAGAGVTLSPAGSGRIATTVAGAYLVTYNIGATSSPTTGDVRMAVSKNGATITVSNSFANEWINYPASATPLLRGTDLIVTANTDYLSVWALAANTVAIIPPGFSQFSVIGTRGQPYYILGSGTNSQSVLTSTITPLTTFWVGAAAPLSSGSIWSVPSNGQIRTAQAGVYVVTFGVALVVPTPTAASTQAWVLVNGATTTTANRKAFAARDALTANTAFAITASAILQLNANDFVQVNYYQDTGSTQTLTTYVQQFSVLRAPGPFGSISSTAPQTIPAGIATELALYWSGSAFTNVGGVVTNPSAGRLRVSVAGGYYLTFGVTWSSGTSLNVQRTAAVYVNGDSAVQYGLVSYGVAAPAAAPTVYAKAQQSAAFVVLNAGDYVSVWVTPDLDVVADASVTTQFAIVQMYSAGTIAPSAAPTKAGAGYLALSSGAVAQAAPSPAGTAFELTTYWTGGAPTVSAGSIVTSTANGRIAGSAAGLYLYTWAAAWAADTTTYRQLWANKNAVAVSNSNRYSMTATTPANVVPIQSSGGIIVLAANDFISIEATTGSTQPMSTAFATQFAMCTAIGNPYYIVYSGTSQTISQNTVTALAAYWTASVVATQSLGSWTAPANGQIQVSATGAYLVFYGVMWYPQAGNKQSWVILNNHGTGSTNRLGYITTSDITNNLVVQASFLVVLAANDFLQAYVYQDGVASGTVGLDLTTSFGMLSVTGPYGSLVTTTAQTLQTATDTELTTLWGGSPFVTDAGGTVTNPSAGRLRVARGGGYFVTFGVYWQSSSSAYKYIWVSVNGGATKYGLQSNSNSASAQQSSAFVPLAPGDYVSVWARQASGSPLNLDPAITTALSIVRMYDAGTTSAPTSASLAPTSSPTSAALSGYYQLFSGTSQAISSATVTEATTYWTGSPTPAKSAGSVVATPVPTPGGRISVANTAAYLIIYNVVYAASVGAAGRENIVVINNACCSNVFTDLYMSVPANVVQMSSASTVVLLTAGNFVSVNIYLYNSAVSLVATGTPQFAVVATKGQPYYILNSGAAQTVLTATITPLTTVWTGAAPQTSGSIWSTPSTGQIRTSQAGTYIVFCGVRWGTSSAAGSRQSWFLVNGATTTTANRFSFVSRDDNTDAANAYTAQTTIMQLSANDFVQVNAYQDSGSSATANSGTSFVFGLMRVTGGFGSISSTTSQSCSSGVDTELTTFWTGTTFTSSGGTVSYNSANPGRLVAERAGAYFVTFGVTWASSTSSNVVRYIWLSVNGGLAIKYGLVSYGVAAPVAAPTAYPKAQQSSAFVVLSAKDYVSVWANAGATISADASITTQLAMTEVSFLSRSPLVRN